jgi:hypothetical protein
MKKRPLCSCGSGLAAEHCCEKFQIHSFTIPFTKSQTREKILKKLQIGSEFQMRNRALAFFYGDDLIAYKLGKPKDPNRNEFLFHLSYYFTDYLEDLSPSSWQECTPLFWEEFISTYFPGRISISKTVDKTEEFFTELQKFVRWLDRKTGTSWFKTVEDFIRMNKDDIKTGEAALNSLVLHHFPHIHDHDFDIQKDFEADQQRLGTLIHSADGLFEVQTVIDDVFVLNNFEDGKTYHTKGLPNCILPGILLKGAIGKRKHDFFWRWCATGAVFPKSSKKFMRTEKTVIIL